MVNSLKTQPYSFNQGNQYHYTNEKMWPDQQKFDSFMKTVAEGDENAKNSFDMFQISKISWASGHQWSSAFKITLKNQESVTFGSSAFPLENSHSFQPGSKLQRVIVYGNEEPQGLEFFDSHGKSIICIGESR